MIYIDIYIYIYIYISNISYYTAIQYNLLMACSHKRYPQNVPRQRYVVYT